MLVAVGSGLDGLSFMAYYKVELHNEGAVEPALSSANGVKLILFTCHQSNHETGGRQKRMEQQNLPHADFRTFLSAAFAITSQLGFSTSSM